MLRSAGGAAFHTAWRLGGRRCASSSSVHAEEHILVRRRGLIFFVGGWFIGGSGLVLRWNQAATEPPPEESKLERRRRKAEARLAAQEDASASCSGLVRRWVGFGELPWYWWLPHWALAEAEVRQSLLLLRGASNSSSTTSVGFADGPRCAALPLGGAKVEQKPASAAAVGTSNGGTSGQHDIVLTTPAGECETLRLPTKEAQAEWARALEGVSSRRRRRVIDVAFPQTWEGNTEETRLVPLDRSSAEFKRVEKLALTQQFRPLPGQSSYVKGKLVVTEVSRVQSPHVWERYAMRRAIIAAENEGDPGETHLWHGTRVPHLILKDGFDPRVCALDGMFGGGVYFANQSTKSLRYAGAAKAGDSGTLLLCRVSLGRQFVKWLPQNNMRRPPDPFPLFGWEHLQMWANGDKFHSVFAPAGITLLMDEFIVYHTNQGVPEYLIKFELE